MNLSEAYKEVVFKKRPVDNGLLVPLLLWTSGAHDNIEKSQEINKNFFYVSKHLLMRSLTFNSVRGFIPFPKAKKDDEKLAFFYKDVALYFGWTTNELNKNLKIIYLEELAPIIATNFGYDNMQRKAVKLPPLKM